MHISALWSGAGCRWWSSVVVRRKWLCVMSNSWLQPWDLNKDPVVKTHIEQDIELQPSDTRLYAVSGLQQQNMSEISPLKTGVWATSCLSATSPACRLSVCLLVLKVPPIKTYLNLLETTAILYVHTLYSTAYLTSTVLTWARFFFFFFFLAVVS